MLVNYEKMVREFMVRRGATMGRDAISGNTKVLRLRLMMEELGELACAVHENNLVEIADGLADLIYVVMGTAIAYDLPIGEIFEEVHRSNMSKPVGTPSGDGKYGDGKIPKGEAYRPPQIRAILVQAGLLPEGPSVVKP